MDETVEKKDDCDDYPGSESRLERLATWLLGASALVTLFYLLGEIRAVNIYRWIGTSLLLGWVFGTIIFLGIDCKPMKKIPNKGLVHWVVGYFLFGGILSIVVGFALLGPVMFVNTAFDSSDPIIREARILETWDRSSPGDIDIQKRASRGIIVRYMDDGEIGRVEVAPAMLRRILDGQPDQVKISIGKGMLGIEYFKEVTTHQPEGF